MRFDGDPVGGVYALDVDVTETAMKKDGKAKEKTESVSATLEIVQLPSEGGMSGAILGVAARLGSGTRTSSGQASNKAELL